MAAANSGSVGRGKPWNWVEYTSEKENEYGKLARKYHNEDYRELALVYAGRCMALQELLEVGGYPECVSKYAADGRKM